MSRAKFTDRNSPGSDIDKRWFAKYQGRDHRVRKLLKGELQELGAPSGHATHVIVRKFSEGVRLRLPCNPPKIFSDNEWTCAKYFRDLIDLHYPIEVDELVRELELRGE